MNDLIARVSAFFTPDVIAIVIAMIQAVVILLVTVISAALLSFVERRLLALRLGQLRLQRTGLGLQGRQRLLVLPRQRARLAGRRIPAGQAPGHFLLQPGHAAARVDPLPGHERQRRDRHPGDRAAQGRQRLLQAAGPGG